MLGFKLTQAMPKRVLDTSPGAHEGFGLHGGVFFVASVNFAYSVCEGAGHMMLRGSDIGENSGAEAALVSNNKEIENAAHVVARQLRHNLMMYKFGVRIGDEFTGLTFMNNITRKHATRNVVFGVLVSICLKRLVAPLSSQLGEIKLNEIPTDGEVSEKSKGLLDDLVSVHKLDLLQDKDVLNILLHPGVGFLFVPIGKPEPGGEQRATLFRLKGESLKPFESSKLKFEMRREKTTSFEDFCVGPRRMLSVHLSWV
jgi:hypothetical protein